MAAAPPRAELPILAKLDLAIETARLRLRPFREADVEDIWPIVSDPKFPSHMTWVAHADQATTRAYIASAATALADNTGVRWAIEHRGKVVGTIGLHVRWEIGALRVDRGGLGYWLAPALWGQGLMTEAVQAVVRCGFDTIGLHKITVMCFADNAQSRRVIEKAAFRWVGRAEDDVWRDGTWHAHLLYELTAPEWPDVHTTMRVQRPTTS